MSYYEPKGDITGPDPREDDPTIHERVVHVTIKLKVDAEFSNRDADDYIDKLHGDIDAVLSISGFRNADIESDYE